VEDDHHVAGVVMTPALEATNLYRFYHAGDDEALALRGLSLAVEPGEVVAVTGPSGSGKSTLLACLAGLDEPDGGMVRVAGTPISRRPEQERAQVRARCIGMLYQSLNLIEHLTVAANIRMVQRLADHASPRPVTELLESVGLAGRAHARPSQLSGGEAARAGLAVAVANDPPVVLADEPTGELDTGSAERVLELLVDRAAAGGAVVVVTHNDAVASAAHRVLRMSDGALET
jgi:putative ABC transport system ATP-binding protein